MSSQRMALVAAVAACLRAIDMDDGFNTNAGAWVTTEPHQVEDESAGLITVVWERAGTPTDAAVRKTHRAVTVAIVVMLPHEQDAAQSRLDQIVEDIEEAMEGQQARFPVGIRYPEYVETLPIPAEKGMGWTGVLIRYESNVPKRRRTPRAP